MAWYRRQLVCCTSERGNADAIIANADTQIFLILHKFAT